jgi:hypothetical protein
LLLIELTAVIFAPSFIGLFYRRGNANEPVTMVKNALCEAIRAGMAFLLHCLHEGVFDIHVSRSVSRVSHTVISLRGESALVLTVLSHLLTHPADCPRHGEAIPYGAPSAILCHDRHCVPNVLAFLNAVLFAT